MSNKNTTDVATDVAGKNFTGFRVKKDNSGKEIFELSSKEAIVLDVSTFKVSAEFVDGLNGETKTNYSRFVGKEVDLFQINTGKKDLFKIGPVEKNSLNLEKFDKGRLTIAFVPE